MKRWALFARHHPLPIAGCVVVVLSCFLSAASAWGSYRAVQAVKADAADRDASQCINSWVTREDIRDAAETSTRGGAEGGATGAVNGLLAFAQASGQPATPGQIDLYRTIAGREAARAADASAKDARAQIPDPTCDLAAAHRRLR